LTPSRRGRVRGRSSASCLADPHVLDALAKAEANKTQRITAGCANQTITWCNQCPRRACGNYAITTPADLVSCVDDKADEMVDGMLCYQFPGSGWSCPFVAERCVRRRLTGCSLSGAA
jgi:hypothetical protein